MSESAVVDSEKTNSSPNPGWLKRVPMLTGVLAGLAGFLTVKSANLSNDAIYRSNQAVLHQAKASDDWTEYQANSIKRHIDEAVLKVATDPDAKKELEAQSKDLRDRQAPLKGAAEAQEASRESELFEGRRRLVEKDMLSYAGVAAQLAIALASVAALTRMKPAFVVGVVAGSLAIALTGYAMLGEILRHFHPG
jgi:hypothetical protein